MNEKEKSDLINEECTKAGVFYLPMSDASRLLMALEVDFKRELAAAVGVRKELLSNNLTK